MHIAAVILAGGRGERLGGVNKASLEVGGRPLLRRVSRALGTAPQPMLVAHGSIPAGQLPLEPHHVPIPDLPFPQAGPLAGVAAAVDHCAGLAAPPDALVTIAVDTPFLPDDYVMRLAAALADAPAVMVSYAGQPYPTSMIWRFEAIRGLPDRMRAGTAPHSLKRLAAAAGAVVLDWPESEVGDPFASINTPEELMIARGRATAG